MVIILSLSLQNPSSLKKQQIFGYLIFDLINTCVPRPLSTPRLQIFLFQINATKYGCLLGKDPPDHFWSTSLFFSACPHFLPQLFSSLLLNYTVRTESSRSGTPKGHPNPISTVVPSHLLLMLPWLEATYIIIRILYLRENSGTHCIVFGGVWWGCGCE